MTEKYDILKNPPKALCFDVFGTVVDWRTTVTQTLVSSARDKTSSSSSLASLTPELKQRLTSLTDSSWAQFAQEWRNSYKKYVHGFDAATDKWENIDTHHRRSLIALLKKWELDGLYSDHEIQELSLVWHYLVPWPDTAAGLRKLKEKMTTSTLSNGNQYLLQDLCMSGKLEFTMLQSSEDFKAYKPSPVVYNGAVKKFGLENGELAMVAAHLVDLKAARGCGLRTIYVERDGEEDWEIGGKEWTKAKEWVDLWVGKEEEGFLEVARRLGIQ